MTTDTVFGTESWGAGRTRTEREHDCGKKKDREERETGGEWGKKEKEGEDIESWIRSEEGAKRQKGPLFIHY